MTLHEQLKEVILETVSDMSISEIIEGQGDKWVKLLAALEVTVFVNYKLRGLLKSTEEANDKT